LAGTGIQRNLEESSAIQRNSGQLQEFLSPVKNSCEHGKKQEFSDRLQKWVPVKKSSGKKFLRNPEESWQEKFSWPTK